MPTIRLRFPGGRYHATPWGHHVNEGLIEWPPSPWRLLRALIACGFSTRRWSEVPPPAERLIEKLAGALPSYRLPTASAAHSRHYMPLARLEKGRESTTLVFDTWANVGDDELLVHWDCELDDEERELFRLLCECLGYLGRSESWVEAEMVEEGLSPPLEFDAFPHREGTRPGPEWEQVSLMAAVPSREYEAWHCEMTEKALAGFPLPGGKKQPPAKLAKDRARAIEPYPDRLIACLTKDTAWWKARGWSQPPGSQRVLYWRRSDSLQVGVPRRATPRPVRPVTTMILAITTPSGNRSALPPNHRTLPQAELYHRAIVGCLGKGAIIDCPEITGRDARGGPLRDNHRHAHIVPIDLDADGHLDHIVIHAPMGLRADAQRAIRSLRRTWAKGGVGELQLALAGSGDLESLRAFPAPLDQAINGLLGPPQRARVWVSATPFVPPRFLKPRGPNTLMGQVLAELASRGLPRAERVEVLAPGPLRHYVRGRRHGGTRPPVDAGFVLELRLAEPRSGPILLGYASHFGMGRFAAAPEQP